MLGRAPAGVLWRGNPGERSGDDLRIGDGEVLSETLSDFAQRMSHEPAPQAELDSAWIQACGREALRVYPEFQAEHPYVVAEPEPRDATPHEGSAYPSLLVSYLEARTGVAGWGVVLKKKPGATPLTIVTEFAVTPPPRPER